MKKHVIGIAILATLLPSAAQAQVVLDGSTSGDNYGSAVSVQTVQTGFGDNASELNAAYGFVSGGNLFLTLTGNLESNFNKLNIFIDSVAGGENVISADINNGGFNPTNDNWANKHAGLTFDTGFAADYLIITRNGNGNQFDFDFSSVGNSSVLDTAGDIFGGSATGANANVGNLGFGVGFDNSNTAGIVGGMDAADQTAAQLVQTGLELIIPLSAIGNPSVGDMILISAMINGSNHDFLSNQILGGLAPPQGNLGGDGFGTFTGDLSLINFNNFAGNQYFAIQVTAIPEPSALAILGMGAMAMIRRRR